MLDFGAWVDEEYSLPTETAELTEEELDALQSAMEKQQGEQ